MSCRMTRGVGTTLATSMPLDEMLLLLTPSDKDQDKATLIACFKLKLLR